MLLAWIYSRVSLKTVKAVIGLCNVTRRAGKRASGTFCLSCLTSMHAMVTMFGGVRSRSFVLTILTCAI